MGICRWPEDLGQPEGSWHRLGCRGSPEGNLDVLLITYFLSNDAPYPGRRECCVRPFSCIYNTLPICQDFQRKKRVGELTALEFRKDCVKGMSNILKKVQDKSPLKYPIMRQVACLDPTVMYSAPDWWPGRMRSKVQKFLQDQQLSGGVSAGMNSK